MSRAREVVVRVSSTSSPHKNGGGENGVIISTKKCVDNESTPNNENMYDIFGNRMFRYFMSRRYLFFSSEYCRR